jgi:hypothetical protein
MGIQIAYITSPAEQQVFVLWEKETSAGGISEP